MIDLSDGCYIFPPTDDGVVKSAIHHCVSFLPPRCRSTTAQD